MLDKLPKIKFDKYGFLSIALCVLALIGYTQPAVNVHLSFLDMTYSSSFGMATVFADSEDPLDMLGLDESELSELLAEVDMVEHFEYVRGRIILPIALYVVVLVLLLVILAFNFWGKFKRAKLAAIAASLALFAIVGSVTFAAQEIVFDILYSALEYFFGDFAALINISEFIYVELGAGYWITMFAIAGMLLVEIAMFLKGRIGVPK